MKTLLRLFTFLFAVAFAAACDSDKDEVTPIEFAGTWQLMEFNAGQQIKDHPTKNQPAAETLGYQEYYILSADGTFRKFRSTGAEAAGTYTVEKIEEKYYAVLEYLESKEVGNDRSISYYGARTHLYLEGNETLYDNQLAHDGGLFIYKRLKEGSK